VDVKVDQTWDNEHPSGVQYGDIRAFEPEPFLDPGDFSVFNQKVQDVVQAIGRIHQTAVTD
jgi:hypothetical protein